MTNETDPGPHPDRQGAPVTSTADEKKSSHEATDRPAPRTTEQSPDPSSGPDLSSGPNPFAGIPVSDYVRDGVAALLLFVSLTMPWDLGHKSSDKVEVILVTVLSLLSLALPYLARTGVLPTTWTVHTTRLARLVANAPFVLVALVYIVLDLVNRAGDNDWGGIGTGLALGLAGALLAAQPRQAELGPVDQDQAVSRTWSLVLAVITGLALLGALVAFVLTFTLDLTALAVLGLLVGTAMTVALVGWPVWGVLLRHDESWRLVLVGLGIALVVLFVLNTSNPLVSLDTFSFGRFGLLLVPAAAVVASSPALARTTRSSSRVGTWVAVAVHAFDLVVVLAAGTALTGVLALAAGGRGAVLILSIVFGLLSVAVALVARRSLARDAVAGRSLALGAAGVVAILGIVLLIVATNQSGASFGTTMLLLAYGLPLVVVFALTVPAEVRTHFAENRPSALAEAAPSAYVWQPPAPRPVRPKPAPEPAAGPYGSGSYATGPDGYGPAAGEQTQTPQPAEASAQPAPAEPAPAEPAPAEPAAQSRTQSPHVRYQPQAEPQQPARPAQQQAQTQQPAQPARQEQQPQSRPVEQYQPTQVLPAQGNQAAYPVQPVVPERSGYAARPGYAAPAVGDTAVLPPYQDPQPAGFSAAQALDPSTPLEVLAQIVQEAPHLRPQVAANPSTYPALLEWLGNLGDPAVDAALRSRGR